MVLNKGKKTKKNLKLDKSQSLKTTSLKDNLQEGGVKFGEGGFGCVIGPYIPCSKKKISSKDILVSKLIHVEDTEEYLEEIELYEKIKRIDHKQRFFVTYIDTCLLNQTEIKNREHDDILKIKFMNKSKTKSDNKYSIIDKNIIIKDQEIDKYCKIDPSLQYFNQIQLYAGIELPKIFKISKNDKTHNIIKLNCRFIFTRLLTGLKILHQNRIAHRDIKPGNILIYIKNLINIIPRFIDFGLSTDLNKGYDLEDIGHRQGTTTYIPVDIYIAYRIIKLQHRGIDVYSSIGQKQLLSEISTMYNKKYKPTYHKEKINKSFLRFKSEKGDTLIDNTEYLDNQDLILLLRKLLKQLAKGTLLANHKRLYDGYLYKADIFALGITFKKFYTAFQINNNKIENLIKHMLSPNPDKRYNVNQCLKHTSLKKDKTRKRKMG